jgi:hypothetical protein
MTSRSDRLPSVPSSLRELDAQQSLFVTLFLELGGAPQHGVEAAYGAGYGETRGDAADAARVLLKSPKIVRAIKEGVGQRFDTAIAAAFSTYLEICTDAKAPANARISAADAILNRSSVGPVPSRSMSITARTSVEDLLEKLDQAEHGEPLDVTPPNAED